MPLTINERVELMFMSGADGITNQSVAEKYNKIYPDHELIFHTTASHLILNW